MTQKEALQKIKEEIAKLTVKQQFPKVSDIGWDTWGYSENKNGDIVGIGLPKIGILDKSGLLQYLKYFPLLSTLNLSVNNIIDIQPLQNLINLTNLHLQANQISDISPLSQLKSLNFINISYNKIWDLSPLAALENLRSLDLNFNKITSIESLKNLTSLRRIYIRGNSIANLDGIENLINLELINVRGNIIRSIASLSNSVNLSYLDLRGNKIQDLTPIQNLAQLKQLDCSDNPINTPPPEIASRGIEAIKQWLKNASEKEYVNEVKVILVGHGYVGKTSLIKCLKGEIPDPSEPATHRIRISDISVAYNANDVKLNFWDFGGQDVMHSLHQFFMSRRSIYLLVLDGRKDEDPEYWLSMIKSCAGDSPVLIVLNKKDSNPSYDVDRRFLQKKYPFILGYYETACFGNIKGINDLQAGLIAALEKVPIVGSKWPKQWIPVKNKLMTMATDFISHADYIQICKDNSINEDKDKELLADFLNDLGIIVHFKEINLESMYILRPQWVSRAAYKIINSQVVADNKGRFKLSDLKLVMAKEDEEDYEYPIGTHKFIVDLMRKFELCYKLYHNQNFQDDGVYLIPELLDQQEPPLPEHTGNCIHFYFNYDDFLPKSIIPRFIVRMHEDIENGMQWRTGLVMKINQFGSRAIVVADIKSKKIHVSVSGNDRRVHFHMIRRTFHDLHSTFENLSVKEWIPLPDDTEYAVEYEDLIGFEIAGKEDYFVGKLRKTYKVKDLLDGIESENSRMKKYLWNTFICHSSIDKPIVREIVQNLQAQNISYWVDEEQINFGDSIIRKISDGLNSSQSIIVCASANQLKSGWAREEYEIILHKMIGNKTDQQVFILILDDIDDKDIPPFLSHKAHVTYKNKSEYNKFLAYLRKITI
jgi:internalin A